MWINAKQELPIKPGWYMCKVGTSEIKVPYAQTYGGALVWVLPNGLDVEYWRDNVVEI